MSEAQLLPTLANFDAIVASKEAAADSGADDAPEADGAYAAEETDAVDEPESQDQDDEAAEQGAGDDEDGEAEEQADPQAEAVEAAMRAPFKAFRAALQSKTMTPELLQAIGDMEWEIPLPGGMSKVRIKDLPGGFMRNARFSREMDKAKEVEGRARNIIEIEQARTASWRQNDMELEQGLMLMGCEQALDKMFWRWAVQKHQYESASPQEKQRIDQIRQMQQQRAIERQQFQEMQRRMQQMQQQGQTQLSPESRQVSEYVNANLDRVLGAALKEAGVDRINDAKRLDFVTEFGKLVEKGWPIDEAMKDAAENIADTYRERRELARQAQQEERQRQAKREVSPKRAPAGQPAQRDAQSGRFKQSGGSRTHKGGSVAEWNRRFG